MTGLPIRMVTRYVAPLREGGSLPGIVEADDLGTYACKFRGAGQGLRVLVAEVIVGELARRLDIATPDLVALELPAEIARYEADEEVQDLLRASVGLNLGVDFLPGSFGYDPGRSPDPELAGRILWLDALVNNVDRSWRNPNMLQWAGALYVIDHGASLIFHHSWPGSSAEAGGDPSRFAAQPYDASEHVLRDYAAEARAQDEKLASTVSGALLEEILALVPDEWLEPVPGAETPAEMRARYVAFLAARIAGGRPWLLTAEPTEGAR